MTRHSKPSRYERVATASSENAWTFPLLLGATVVSIVWMVISSVGLPTGPIGEALSARLTWAVTAMLFGTVFVFAIIQCHVLMFRCGRPEDALSLTVATTIMGLATTLYLSWNNDMYLGPSRMKALLEGTAFTLKGVRVLTAMFDGLAFWAAFVVLGTSCAILRNDIVSPEELSRQIRASRILLSVGSALLITGVAQSSALHRWPAAEIDLARQCCSGTVGLLKPDALQKEVYATALAISTTAGAACSLILAAAYLPLGLLLRQRAYRVVRPWERTEAWLAMHGLSLKPMQQLGKVFLMLGPFLAGGPMTSLISIMTQ